MPKLTWSHGFGYWSGTSWIDSLNLSQIQDCRISKCFFGGELFLFLSMFLRRWRLQITFEDPLTLMVSSLRAQLVGKTHSTKFHSALEIRLQNHMHWIPPRHRSRIYVLILTLIKPLHKLCIQLCSEERAGGEVEGRGWSAFALFSSLRVGCPSFSLPVGIEELDFEVKS